MDVLGAGGAVARRFIKRNGDDVVFTNEDVTVDTSTDWDDETYTTTTATYKSIISRTRVRAERTERETGPGVDVDYVLYVADDDTDSFTIRDARDDDPPTTATFGGTEHHVVGVQTHIDGITVVEVRHNAA